MRSRNTIKHYSGNIFGTMWSRTQSRCMVVWLPDCIRGFTICVFSLSAFCPRSKTHTYCPAAYRTCGVCLRWRL